MLFVEIFFAFGFLFVFVNGGKINGTQALYAAFHLRNPIRPFLFVSFLRHLLKQQIQLVTGILQRFLLGLAPYFDFLPTHAQGIQLAADIIAVLFHAMTLIGVFTHGMVNFFYCMSRIGQTNFHFHALI